MNILNNGSMAFEKEKAGSIKENFDRILGELSKSIVGQALLIKHLFICQKLAQ